MAVAACTNVIGFNPLQADVDATYGLGTQVLADDATTYIYGVAGDSVAVGTCTYTIATRTITDAVGVHTADVAIPAGQYGWVRLTAGIV